MRSVVDRMAEVQIALKIIIPTLLLMLSGCIPLIKESSAAQIAHPNLRAFFPNEDQDTMVIPVWEKYPAFMSEQSVKESSTLLCSDPVFTKVSGLSDVHNLIPSKTSAGLIIFGPLAGVGRGIFFYGYIIISERGKVLFLDKNQDNTDLTYYVSISDASKRQLIDLMRSEKHIELPDSGAWKFFDHKEVRVNFSDAEKDRIIAFLTDIDPARLP